ncbi:unnamed protein product [Auanema sp. JU1783]|nr:unnamed protein product [Auanema sp. JU1783]
MPKRKASNSKSRIEKNETQDESVANSSQEIAEAYVVESFIRYRVEAKEVQYLIKWEGYSEKDNSFERENRIIFYTDILDYWLNKKNSEDLSDKDLKIMHGTFLYQTLQSSFGRFMFTKTVPIRNDIIDENPEWDFRYAPWSYDLSQALQAHYSNQLRLLNGMFSDFPFFEMYNEFDSAMPLPLSRYAFDDYLSPGDRPLESNSDNKYLLSEECLDAYERGTPMPVNDRDTFSNNLIKNAKLRIFFQTNHTFLQRKEPVHMVIIRREERRWEIISRGPISPDVQIMPIGGKVVRKSVASEAMDKHGELIAFPFFVALDDAHCLDRREISDFSQYLVQSCDPNCFVKREYINGKAKLFVYTRRSIVPGETLTLDWFTAFPTGKYGQHELLVDQYVDHVLCSCGTRKCRSVLWQRVTKGKRKSIPVEEFGGLKLV